MQKDYSWFEEKISSYCNKHVGEEVLFPAFADLWNNHGIITKKDLVFVTSKIIAELLDKDFLREVPKKKGFENGYGLYRILPQDEIIE